MDLLPPPDDVRAALPAATLAAPCDGTVPPRRPGRHAGVVLPAARLAIGPHR